MSKLVEDIKKLEGDRIYWEEEAARLRQMFDQIKLENEQLRNQPTTMVPYHCYESAVNRCNQLIWDNKVLQSQLEAQMKITDTTLSRNQELVCKNQMLEEELTGTINPIKYGFKVKNPLVSVDKSNGEICTLFEANSGVSACTKYILLEVEGTDRRLCLRKDEWNKLVKKYFKEYLI